MLTNKTALVTGASRGIGAAIAKSLAKEGAFVIINYNGSKERANAVAAEITADGGKAAVYGCNVSDYSACEKMAKDIMETYGHLDILVNNAGITRDDLLMKMSEEAFDAVIATNLKGTFNTIRHFSRYPPCVKIYDKAKKRQDYQSGIGCRSDRKCRTGKLQREQGGRDRTDQKCGKGTFFPWDYLQCGCAGIH